jgi:phage terminase large subunit
MAFVETTATTRILRLKKRIRLLAGGMRASKTVSVLLYLIDDASTDKTPTLTSVVSESMPHLRRGAIRDFENIMKQHGYWSHGVWNASTFTFTFPNGSRIEFFSADQSSKIRGPSRDRLFVNEVNNIDQESWEQLLFRTRQYAFADWNPVGDFFLYEDYGLHDDENEIPYSTDDRVDFIILTYKDNEALEESIVQDIERKAAVNSAWAKVYAHGRRGDMDSKIFQGWKIIDEIPHEAKLECRGMDFGYSADPTAICDIYYYNGGYIVDEVAYRTGMLHSEEATLLVNLPNPNTLVIADSADPEAIAVLQNAGVNAIGVIKRPGVNGKKFTNNAFDFVNDQKMSITKRSTKFIESYRNFSWKVDKDGKQLDDYDHFKSDGMMALTYGMTNFDTRRREKETAEPYMTGNIESLWY